MTLALFGKLPSKRDFVAVDMPRDLLRLWEAWLQGSVSAAQNSLGARWHDTYLTAPIWRFWLGSGLAGREVVGALMPSLDGVGRFFPLAVFAVAGEGESVAPPADDSQAPWFEAAEAFLLETLDAERPYDEILAALRALPPPATQTPSGPGAAFSPAPATIGLVSPDETGFERVMAELDTVDVSLRRHASSYWWTIGGEACAPLGLRSDGMPAPQAFAFMLTGVARVADPAEEPAAETAETGAEP